VITLFHTMGTPSAPTCTGVLEVFSRSKRKTRRPPWFRQERVMASGNEAGRAGARSAAASTSPEATCAVTWAREAEVVTFCHAPPPAGRTRRVMSPRWK